MPSDDSRRFRKTSEPEVDFNSEIESPEDIQVWVVVDEEIQDDEDLEGAIFCSNCISSYVGDGKVQGVDHDSMEADVFCQECGVFLGDE